MSDRYTYPTGFCSWGPEEREAMAKVIESGRFTMGQHVEAFEAEMSAHQQRKHGVFVNSGSSANYLAVAALGMKKEEPLRSGGLAAVPALGWATTIAPVVQHGLQLQVMDCGPDWNTKIAGSAYGEPSSRILAMVSSVLGNPADLPFMQNLSGLGAYIINDNCSSLGAEIGDKPTGAYGDISTTSFFYSHQLSATEGGMIFTDDKEIADICRMLRDHGMSRSVRPADSFDTEYNFEVFGYNMRGVEMHAAVAREQLKKFDAMRTWRQRNWTRFRLLTNNLPIEMPTPNGVINPFGLHFTVPSNEARALLARMLREEGIDCRTATGGSFLRHPYGAPWREQKTPTADRIHDTGIFLGNAGHDISGHVEHAADVISRWAAVI